MDFPGSHILDLKGVAITEEAHLLCSTPTELVLWAKDRLGQTLKNGPISNSDKYLTTVLDTVSKDLSSAFNGNYTVQLLDYETDEPISYITESDDLILVVDSLYPPFSTEYH